MYLLITIILTIFSSAIAINSAAADHPSTLKELVEYVYTNNSEIKHTRALALAEKQLRIVKGSFADPSIGVSRLERSGETNYIVISQKIDFPAKYHLREKAQDSLTKAQEQRYNSVKLKLKQRTHSLYYSIYATQKIISLTKTNMEILREFARVAEKKYAAGESPRTDSMKAHFEQTSLELDLLTLQESEKSLQTELRSILNNQSFPRLNLSNKTISTPTLTASSFNAPPNQLLTELTKNSPILRSEHHLVENKVLKSRLAKWAFAPDFKINYQKRIDGLPKDSKIYGVNMTIPLYFWKQSAAHSAAKSQLVAQKHQLKNKEYELINIVTTLKSRVLTGLKMLTIYSTSLIPQAQGSYNSSRSAYRANKTSFLNLLDSERSLYKVQTRFYRSLQKYTEDLSQLEKHIGHSISSLGRDNS